MLTDETMAVEEQLERRRNAVAERWNLTDEVILVAAGELIPIPGGADLTYPFRPHSEFFYLTDRRRPGGVLAFDPEDGWTQFVRPVTTHERVWIGETVDESELEGRPLEELEAWIVARSGRRTAWLGQPPAAASSDPELEHQARLELNHVRRQKDDVELERMRRAEEATRAGYEALVPLIAPGASERGLQIELEAAFFRNGADGVGYDTIVGSGPNSAVFHFAPTARELEDGELVLVDAGGQYRGYTSDVTRTYPASGSWSPEQAEVRAIVLAAVETACDLCRPGAEWRDVHLAAARTIAEGLVSFGLLRGEIDDLIEGGAVKVFFPHSIGHMVGLGVRDAGEILPGRDGVVPGLPQVRHDLPLLAGHVFTVEPGVYVVPALLDDEETRRTQRTTVDWDRADRMRRFGGIRMEQNVLITDDGHEVLTADIPIA